MKYTQVLSNTKLQKTDRVLFLIHLAIGDYTYMQNMFRAFHQKYPHIKIDLFILENRCTEDASKWPALENYVIYDWLETCGFYNKIYRRNYAPKFLKESIAEAHQQKYPIVITLGTLQDEQTEILGRKIAGEQGLLVGLKINLKWYRFKHHLIKRPSWRVLDLAFYSKPLKPGDHISAVYNSWAEQLAGVTLSPQDRLPFVDIPEQWLKAAQKHLQNLKIVESSPTIFINYIAKDPKRSWKVEQALKLVEIIQQNERFQKTTFLINTLPELISSLDKNIKEHSLSNTYSYSATENFYQLPAMLELSDLIISVETSVIHLANAVKTPVIALMRQRTPHWVPLDKSISTVIWVPKKKDNIDSISPELVAKNVFKALTI
ncbi:glycosyltransferase family 9 protein [Ignatzschineria cameli]|uniref:Glycosyl transferase n=1 Tax=Ignatzschineria cameli TaxID=2182793 RepID=A0A2U2AQM7_9GAMM|nr:glycosyltransferase family 9 protein [Ignatzschineria cameli]PWD86187.1 glycosyl transferase [Ignatzschineria cameli]